MVQKCKFAVQNKIHDRNETEIAHEWTEWDHTKLDEYGSLNKPPPPQQLQSAWGFW
jgi:hypothetical protein